MPARPVALPAHLVDRPFHVREASGVSPWRLRGADLWRPAAGVRLPLARTDVQDVCAAIALTLPDGAVFSHSTAARLLGLPLPLRLQNDDRVHVTTPTGTRARRGALISGHQMLLPETAVMRFGNLPLTRPVRTLLDLSRTLNLLELVQLGDAVARMSGMDAIRSSAAALHHTRHPSVLAEAIDLMDPRSESPKETEVRLLVHDAGFTQYIANFELFDADGNFIARLDLADPRSRTALEYEGDYHRDRGQWRRDHARRRRIEAAGWTYIPVTQLDLDDPAALIRDLRAFVDRATRPAA